MFIYLHSKETDKPFVVNTDYIVTMSDTVYDDSTMSGAVLVIIRFGEPVEVKETVTDIERLMKQARAQQSNNEVHLL